MYDRIYTVGCFDYFHKGHKILFQNMREYGKIIIAGVHNDSSIERLKKLRPDQHQSLKTRMKNVKEFADIVYVIPDEDPTFFVDCILRKDDNKVTACFIRADDMPNFPGKMVIENIIDIKLLPYTDGISSTQIRNYL